MGGEVDRACRSASAGEEGIGGVSRECYWSLSAPELGGDHTVTWQLAAQSLGLMFLGELIGLLLIDHPYRTRNGPAKKVHRYKWPLLLGFKSERQAKFTADQLELRGLNINDLSSIDEVHRALQPLIGQWYYVRVIFGNRFVNTYVNSKAAPSEDQTDIVAVADDGIPY